MKKKTDPGSTSNEGNLTAQMLADTDFQASFFDLAGIIMVALDRDGRIAFINEEGCRALGLTRDELLGMDWFNNFIPINQREMVRDVFDSVISGRIENMESFENCILTAHGLERLIFWKNSNLYNNKGEIQYTFSSGLDITEHREVEQTARENEERFLQLAENIEEVFWIVSPDWSRVHYISPAYEKLWGRPCEELYQNALAWLDGVHPDDRLSVKEAIHQNTATHMDDPSFPEYRVVRPDGSVRIVLVRAFPVRKADGEIFRIAGIAQDITDWKTAVKALEASEERLRHITENALDIVFRWRFYPSGAFEYISPSAQRITAIPPERFYADPEILQEHIHHDDREMMLQVVGQIRQGKMPSWEGAFRWKGPDEKTFWMEGSVVPVFDPSNKVVAMEGIIRDVTLRRRSEQALLESEKQYRGIFDNAGVGVVVTDPVNQRIEWVNRRATQMFGYSPAELKKMTSEKLTHPEDRELSRNMADRINEETKSITFEKRYLSKDGTVIWARLNVSPLEKDEAGNATKCITVIEDISDLKTMESKMQHAQKLESLGVLAGGIAHDFNNILMAVLGNASLARHKVPDGSELATYIEKVLDAAQHAAELTNQMLAYSGKGHFQVAPLDLNQTLEGMRSLLDTVIPKKIRLKLDLEQGVPAIMGDGTQIRQVIMNLITNAADAIGDGPGTIQAGTGQLYCDREYLQKTLLGEELEEGQYVFLDVIDNGCGMNDEIMGRIFEPFFTAKEEGRGLGLAAILGILRGHGGAVAVSSRPGEGSTFRILLPASEKPVKPAKSHQEELLSRARDALLLVVDDDPMVLDVAAAMLEEAGFKVISAEDGIKAVEIYKAEQDRIDAVLMDMSMPELGGQDAARQIKALDPAARIILSSGYTEMDILPEESSRMVDGFIQKPYRYEDLIKTVEEALK